MHAGMRFSSLCPCCHMGSLAWRYNRQGVLRARTDGHVQGCGHHARQHQHTLPPRLSRRGDRTAYVKLMDMDTEQKANSEQQFI